MNYTRTPWSLHLPASVQAAKALILIACWAAPCSLGAQADHDLRIAGRVLNAETGAPLPRAAVAIVVVPEGGDPEAPRMARLPDRPRRGPQRSRRSISIAAQSTLSADDGSFAFENVAPGKYSLEGSRRGYLTTSYQEHGNYSTAIVVAPGQHTEDLTLQLSPGATLSGTLTDASGDSVDQATVTLYRQEEDGLGSIHMYRGARVDDTGAFEFAHLPPGIYFVSAAGRVWFAQAGAQATNAASADSIGNRGRFTPDAPTDLDLVYPRTFYADAADSAAATPIPVHGGERLRVDLHLSAVPAVHLLYTQPATATSFRMPLLSQPVFGEPEFSTSAMSTRSFRSPQEGGGAMVLSVAPGDYEVEVGGRTLSVHAGGDLQLDPAAGQSTVELSGRLAASPGAELPEQVFLTFHGTGARGGQLNAPVGRDGSFRLDSLRPGSYELDAFGAGRPVALMGAAVAGAELQGNRLTVGAQPVTLALTAAPASAIVAGFVDDPPPGTTEAATGTETGSAAITPPYRPASGVMVVLVPEHLADHALFRRDQSDSDGSFSLRDCAPGRYTAVAIRDGWDLDWARPAVIRHYLPGGEPVTIPPNTRAITRLPGPLIAQPR